MNFKKFNEFKKQKILVLPEMIINIFCNIFNNVKMAFFSSKIHKIINLQNAEDANPTISNIHQKSDYVCMDKPIHL